MPDIETIGCRQLRVWSRECVHQSTSENADAIEGSLAWKPSGSLVATSQRKPNKHDVVFFEKNGLRHGEFTLPFDAKEVKVKQLLWNTESTILCVWCEALPPEGSTDDKWLPKSCVQLWTVNNYHWYLKQNLSFNVTASDKVVAILWDPECACRLHILYSGGHYIQYTWSWTTNHSRGLTTEDTATVAVIDGAQVLCSPMQRMVVPPPMCSYSLQLPVPVNQVLFGQPPTSNDLAVILEDGRIALYSFTNIGKIDDSVKLGAAGGNGFTVNCQTPNLQGIYKLKGIELQYPLSLHQFVWPSPDCLVFSGLSNDGNHSILYIGEIIHDDQLIAIRSQHDVEGHIYTMTCSLVSPCVAIQLTDGRILRYETASDGLLPWETPTGSEMQFRVPCVRTTVCTFAGQEVILGLTERFRFYVNEVEIASNCTSFAVHEKFVLLTTLAHTCRCISREVKVQDLPFLEDGKAHPFDESVRRVERGSQIVLVVPGDTKVVLQMPRGNLETIHPRALVLSAVRSSLERNNYKAAFMEMRKHRINMNLLYDHNPTEFLKHVGDFIDQVASINFINLFLTDLREEDVTQTMYNASYNGDMPRSHAEGNPSKIDIVCDAILRALREKDSDKYLLSILTACVKKTSPQLEESLLLIKSLRDNPTTAMAVGPEEALRYMLFLVDVNQLYDMALGTYDFDLVLMVAEKSQKDPKEYIPFLNHLRGLEPTYQRFTIDKHLKRYHKALQHMSQCSVDHFDECLQLVKDQKLYAFALSVFSQNSNEYKQMAAVYGDYLVEKNRHQEAGIVYTKALLWEQALSQFVHCNNWRQALNMASILNYPSEKLAELARKLGAQLKDQGRPAESAVVYEQYAEDPEEAIVTLIDGIQWEEALRLMYKHRRTDFIETNLKPALEDCYAQQMSSIQSYMTDFEHHKSRLTTVRTNKEKMNAEFLESDLSHNFPNADLFSDTSSATGESLQSQYTADSQRSTVFTKISGKSSKNRRKASRKKSSLKEGSQHEDTALIEALSKIVTYADMLKSDISSMLCVLVQFNYDMNAMELQASFDGLLKLIDRSIPEIWIPTDIHQGPILGPGATSNTIAQAVQQGHRVNVTSEEEAVIRTPPKVSKDLRWKLHMLEPKQ